MCLGGSPGSCPRASAGPGCHLLRRCPLAQGPQVAVEGTGLKESHLLVSGSAQKWHRSAPSRQSEQPHSPAELWGAGQCGAPGRLCAGSAWSRAPHESVRGRGRRTRKALGPAAVSVPASPAHRCPGPRGLSARCWCPGLRLPLLRAQAGPRRADRRCAPILALLPVSLPPRKGCDEPPLGLPRRGGWEPAQPPQARWHLHVTRHPRLRQRCALSDSGVGWLQGWGIPGKLGPAPPAGGCGSRGLATGHRAVCLQVLEPGPWKRHPPRPRPPPQPQAWRVEQMDEICI